MAEQKGIITGIGNTITPEIDAVINDYIIGENTIIQGLENEVSYKALLPINTISAGMCQLCGYRGILPNDTILRGVYVYGKFVLHFDDSIEDEFYIVATHLVRTTATEITGAGTYYIKLYDNGVKQVSEYNYPKNAHIADTATNLIPNGTIGNNVTAVTQPINDNSTKVATTEYVKNQIENDIAKETKTFVHNSEAHTNSSYYTTVRMTIKYASKIAVIQNTVLQISTNYSSALVKSDSSGKVVLFVVDNKFRPTAEISLGKMYVSYSGTFSMQYKTVDIYISINGEVCIGRAGDLGGNTNIGLLINESNTNIYSNIGYVCN